MKLILSTRGTNIIPAQTMNYRNVLYLIAMYLTNVNQFKFSVNCYQNYFKASKVQFSYLFHCITGTSCIFEQGRISILQHNANLMAVV